MKTPLQTIKHIEYQMDKIKFITEGIINWEDSPSLVERMKTLKDIKKFIKE